nr:uncharacterized protein LOC112785628 [Arachis hypogaea]
MFSAPQATPSTHHPSPAHLHHRHRRHHYNRLTTFATNASPPPLFLPPQPPKASPNGGSLSRQHLPPPLPLLLHHNNHHQRHHRFYSLRINDNDVVADPPAVSPTSQPHEYHDNAHGSEPEDDEDEEDQGQGCGVKEDLDEIKQTLTRQFWGMASFLAPPPPSNSNPSSSPSHNLYQDSIPDHSRPDYSDVDQPDPEPIGSDFGGNHRGITDEVLSFAFNIAMHPETWLDFPIDKEDDPQDFDMSDAQQEHAVAIERLIPRLNALRIELCPCHMSESYFWKVYFVLLHSRLNKEDASILSTPQITGSESGSGFGAGCELTLGEVKEFFKIVGK